MDRPSIRFGVIAVVLVAAVALASFGGCQSAFFTLAYLYRGTDEPLEYPGLKGKEVVVVCRPPMGIQYVSKDTGRDIARGVAKLLKDKVPKIKMIPSDKAEDWCDHHKWEEFVEVGKAMKADMVVGIELEKYNIYQTQTLYQGKANATVHVYDCKDGKVVFEKILPPTVYPPNTFIQASDMQEGAFRQEFIGVLSDRIARHFYEHDPHADMGQDTAALK